jgi:hypothetical protein
MWVAVNPFLTKKSGVDTKAKEEAKEGPKVIFL